LGFLLKKEMRAITVIVQVTDSDIFCGRPRHPRECPIAFALARSLRRTVSVSQWEFFYYADAGDGPFSCRLPAKAADSIFDCDLAMPVRAI
jgi:hypothetical protein